VAFRSDCNKARPWLVLVVAKNVRAELRACSGWALREGRAISQGLKPDSFPQRYGTAQAVP